MRKFAFYAFCVDCILSFFIVIGVYFMLEEIHREYYMAYGHYVLIDCSCLFIMSALFSLSTFLRLKKTLNGFLVGFILLILADIATIKVIEAIWVSNPLLSVQILLIIFLHALFAFYLQINSYLLLIMR